jgi:small subunit ribosomal protein S8
MATSDPIADFLTRLRNASRAGKQELLIPYSRMKENIARILKDEGYITSYAVQAPGDESAFPRLHVVNKFTNRVPALTGLRRVSKPGLRRYVAVQEIPRVLGGLGVSILSTPRGVLSGREAKKQNVGGELLAIVW